jgi:hypothetical protein
MPGGPRQGAGEQLERACTRGRGHILVTGEDREKVESLLRRTLEKIEPMATVRASATSVERSIDEALATILGESTETGLHARHARLLELVARASETDRSIFFVVDDATGATLDQIERMFRSIDVAPDALRRLRIVLLGDTDLRSKLASCQERAIAARIGAEISVNDTESALPPPIPTTIGMAPEMPKASGRAWTLATSAAIAFSLSVYASAVWFGGGQETTSFRERVMRGMSIDGLDLARTADSISPTARGLRGDEPFLRTSLAILPPGASAQRPRSSAAPTPEKASPSRQARPVVAATTPSAAGRVEATQTAKSTPLATARPASAPQAARPANATVTARTAPSTIERLPPAAGARAAATTSSRATPPPAPRDSQPSPESSIGSLMGRFR